MSGNVSKSGNLYAVLEVSPRASLDVIKAAYRTLAQVYHPDKGGGNSVKIVSLNQAYKILSDPETRAHYDREREQEDPGGGVVGSYRVLKEIAEGGFGKTYKGEHVRLGTPVCLKHCSRVSSLDNEILQEEAEAMWDLRHFAIPSVRDLIEIEDGSFVIAMSYIPGPTLEQIVKKVGRLDPEHVAWITERILNALMYLHHHGIIHGDLKPQNIIVQPENHTIVLVDFGLSMIKPSVGSRSKGYTEYFAPPEEVQRLPLLPESDFYSLGMTMLYALGGGLEYVGKKEVPGVTPDPMCDFIRKLIVRDILARPKYANELFEMFRKVRERAFGKDRSGMKPIKGI